MVRLAAFAMVAAVAGCTSDSFHEVQDAGLDAVNEPAQDVIPIEAAPTEASSGDAAPSTFCTGNASAHFCEDFDEGLPHPWTRWSTSTLTGATSALTFTQGVTGQAGEANAVGLVSTAYLTKQMQGPVLGSLDIEVKVVAAANSTLVRVVASGKTFALVTDLAGASFVVNGDTSTTKALGPANDGNWHQFHVVFNGALAVVSEDTSAFNGSVSFPVASPTDYALDVGAVITTAGATVVADNIVLN